MKSKKKIVKKKASAKKASSKRTTKKVSAVPKGYHNITSYLIVSRAGEAIGFYKQAFGAKEMMRMELPGGKIAHSELKIGDTIFMLADEHPEKDARSPDSFGGSPITMLLYTKGVDNVVERAIAAGAKLIKPVEDMFYGDRSGVILDPYGYKWHISTHIEDVTPAQMKKRAAEYMENEKKCM